MDHKLNFVREGMIKLPPGFRFQPTDEELVFEYLKRKVLSWPLPASVIPDINLYKFDPWDLPGDMERERYFFSNMEAKYPNGSRVNRKTASGYWKATGLDRQIGPSSTEKNQMMGMKKTLVFYRVKPSQASRTDWIMHEYRLVSLGALPNNSLQGSFNQPENWVLCRVFLKNRSRNNEIFETGDDRLKFFDFMKRDDTVSCSSSCSSSSSVTEVSLSGDDREEGSSSRC